MTDTDGRSATVFALWLALDAGQVLDEDLARLGVTRDLLQLDVDARVEVLVAELDRRPPLVVPGRCELDARMVLLGALLHVLIGSRRWTRVAAERAWFNRGGAPEAFDGLRRSLLAEAVRLARAGNSSAGELAGGARVVYHLTPRLAQRFDDPEPGHIVLVQPHPDGGLDCTLALEVQDKPNRVALSFRASVDAGDGTTWRLRQLGPGVWNVEPSIDHPLIHAYVTICGVPSPAPWEASAAGSVPT